MFTPPYNQTTTFEDLVTSNRNSTIKDIQTVIECIKQKLEEESMQKTYNEPQPIHRFLILKGDKFQNYKSEAQQVVKKRSTHNVLSMYDGNILMKQKT